MVFTSCCSFEGSRRNGCKGRPQIQDTLHQSYTVCKTVPRFSLFEAGSYRCGMLLELMTPPPDEGLLLVSADFVPAWLVEVMSPWLLKSLHTECLYPSLATLPKQTGPSLVLMGFHQLLLEPASSCTEGSGQASSSTTRHKAQLPGGRRRPPPTFSMAASKYFEFH